MRISDWSSDVCSSDLEYPGHGAIDRQPDGANTCPSEGFRRQLRRPYRIAGAGAWTIDSKFLAKRGYHASGTRPNSAGWGRSEEHTSELQSLMRISYAVFCLKKKNTILRSTNIRL